MATWGEWKFILNFVNVGKEILDMVVGGERRKAGVLGCCKQQKSYSGSK